MTSSPITTVFFDLGDTLGTAVVSGTTSKLLAFDVYPYTLSVLQDLKMHGLKLGVISNTGEDNGRIINDVLAPTGLLDIFDPELMVYSGDEAPLSDGSPVTKREPEIFRRAAERAGSDGSPAQVLFVGEDANERQVAITAGWRVCPHPLLVGEVLSGQALRYVRIEAPVSNAVGPWRNELHKRAFIPMGLVGTNESTVYGLTSQRVALELINMCFKVDFLGRLDLPLTDDLYLLRDDIASESGFLSNKGTAERFFSPVSLADLVLSATTKGIIAGFSPSEVNTLDTFHFDGARHGHNFKLFPDPLIWSAAPLISPLPRFSTNTKILPSTVEMALAAIDSNEVTSIVNRYSGIDPLNGVSDSVIVSRHIHHVDNARAVAQIAADLESVGKGRLKVILHRFTHMGVELFNVEAELAGLSPELVFVTAHLDSTAAYQEPYIPDQDPAPGADDDASGLAAVLLIASCFAELARTEKPARTIRFVLFNAEEQGLIGSQAYAKRSKSRGEAIAAVWQMDMIGYNKQAPRAWEVHAGFEQSPEVEAKSRALAELILIAGKQVSPSLPIPQIYHSRTVPSGDPAAGRSDHAPFQMQGYAAVVVSEDFFIGPGEHGPTPEENPNYHKQEDRFVDAVYTADIARAVGAAAWISAAQASADSYSSRKQDDFMPISRELDTRINLFNFNKLDVFTSITDLPQSRINTLTGSQATVVATEPSPMGKSLVDRALAFARSESKNFGFSAGAPAEFSPDSLVQRTSAGGAAVHLKQQYQGLTVFQMSRTVRFNPVGQVIDATGDTARIPDGLDLEPKLSVQNAVLAMANHLAATGTEEMLRDVFGEEVPRPTVDIKDFVPEIIAGFPLPSRATVLTKGPFENPIPAYLLIFNQPEASRLAWHAVFTFAGYEDQYTVIVAADNQDGEILYSKSTMHRAAARGLVYEFSPGIANRLMIDFPRPLTDYPAMPGTPMSGFPGDWVETDKTIGNSTHATLNFSDATMNGIPRTGVTEFRPDDGTGDEQKLLNIFYFCNYMHDFLYVLGFDEASGNFQKTNFTRTGVDEDPVRARAHSGPVNGTANMSTGPDGLPPIMNMGLVSRTGNHTAFDADVVFHEYVHGLTNRLVGGRLNGHSLDKLQSGGMGEGWSDYYALTIQSYHLDKEKTVAGNWVLNDPAGIRRAPYDDNYPFNFGDLPRSPEVHDIGEVWCATLMMMTRKIRASLGNDQQGYKLAWQMVTDGLKLTPANPTFLDARDAILLALSHLNTTNYTSTGAHSLVHKAAWEAFAHFGMGINASCGDADDVSNIVADSTLPTGI